VFGNWRRGEKIETKSVLFETLIVTAVTLLGMWLLPAYKTGFALIPLVYILIERRLRRRSWKDIGFRFCTFWPDLRATWFWLVLVGVISQPLIALVTKIWFPAYLEHVIDRLPFNDGTGFGLILPMLAVSLVLEELTYRTLIQGRLTPYIGAPLAIVVASILFGFAHFASGPFWIVFLDVGMIILDSILYGVIYKRCGNIVVTWLAHLIGDVLGLIVIIAL
jgi:membrane protease YdiL (CAAX protease family)